MKLKNITLHSGCKRIYVAKPVLANNDLLDLNNPPFSVIAGKREFMAHTITFHGSSRLVYRRKRPMKYGAQAWVETYDAITFRGYED